MQVVDIAMIRTTRVEDLEIGDHILIHDHEMVVVRFCGIRKIITKHTLPDGERERLTERTLTGTVYKIIEDPSYKTVCMNCRKEVDVTLKKDYCEECELLHQTEKRVQFYSKGETTKEHP